VPERREKKAPRQGEKSAANPPSTITLEVKAVLKGLQQLFHSSHYFVPVTKEAI
jgi:hypothetical protein